MVVGFEHTQVNSKFSIHVMEFAETKNQTRLKL